MKNDDISSLPVTSSLRSSAKQWLFYTKNQVDDTMLTLQDILGFSDVFPSFIWYICGFDHNFHSSSPNSEKEHSN